MITDTVCAESRVILEDQAERFVLREEGLDRVIVAQIAADIGRRRIAMVAAHPLLYIDQLAHLRLIHIELAAFHGREARVVEARCFQKAGHRRQPIGAAIEVDDLGKHLRVEALARVLSQGRRLQAAW